MTPRLVMKKNRVDTRIDDMTGKSLNISYGFPPNPSKNESKVKQSSVIITIKYLEDTLSFLVDSKYTMVIESAIKRSSVRSPILLIASAGENNAVGDAVKCDNGVVSESNANRIPTKGS